MRIGFQFLKPFFCSWYWGRKKGGLGGRFEELIARELLRRRGGGGLERDWLRDCSSRRRSEAMGGRR